MTDHVHYLPQQYFVETTDFDLQVPCFNVTAESFDSTVTSTVAVATATSVSSSGGSSSLSKGAIAGIAVGTIVGSLSIVGAAAYMLLKKRKNNTVSDQTQGQEMHKMPNDAGSVNSTN